MLHEPLIDEDPVFVATCTERELRKRKKRKFSLWVRQCSSTGFIVQVGWGWARAHGAPLPGVGSLALGLEGIHIPLGCPQGAHPSPGGHRQRPPTCW